VPERQRLSDIQQDQLVAWLSSELACRQTKAELKRAVRDPKGMAKVVSGWPKGLRLSFRKFEDYYGRARRENLAAARSTAQEAVAESIATYAEVIRRASEVGDLGTVVRAQREMDKLLGLRGDVRLLEDRGADDQARVRVPVSQLSNAQLLRLASGESLEAVAGDVELYDDDDTQAGHADSA